VNTAERSSLGVGPVLHATPFAAVVVAAIEAENEGVVVQDEGAYLRVQVPRVCRLSRSALMAAAGHEVHLPGDLEVIMSPSQVWSGCRSPVPCGGSPLSPFRIRPQRARGVRDGR
jgi:hypothetical protein